MKCPKCGQETVHINNKHICTACGIVVSDIGSPKEQVLNQIRPQKPEEKQEEYVSPVELAKPAPVQQVVEEKPLETSGVATMVPPKSNIPDFPGVFSGVNTNHNLNMTAKETPVEKPVFEAPAVDPGQPTQSSSVFPNHGNVPTRAAEEEAALPAKQPEDLDQSEQMLNIEPLHLDLQVEDNQGLQAPPQPQSAVSPQTDGSVPQADIPMIDPNLQSLYGNNAEAGKIYPSHQVSPILLKILIFSFIALVLFGMVYLFYIKSNSFHGIGNIGQFLGEKLFK